MYRYTTYILSGFLLNQTWNALFAITPRTWDNLTKKWCSCISKMQDRKKSSLLIGAPLQFTWCILVRRRLQNRCVAALCWYSSVLDGVPVTITTILLVPAGALALLSFNGPVSLLPPVPTNWQHHPDAQLTAFPKTGQHLISWTTSPKRGFFCQEKHASWRSPFWRWSKELFLLEIGCHAQRYSKLLHIPLQNWRIHKQIPPPEAVQQSVDQPIITREEKPTETAAMRICTIRECFCSVAQAEQENNWSGKFKHTELIVADHISVEITLFKNRLFILQTHHTWTAQILKAHLLLRDPS